MNPEFRRQLTLELTPSRLILMPAILLLLGVCLFAIEKSAPVRFLHHGALTILGLLGATVGTFTALSSINDEVNDRTWDQQRMSAMTLVYGMGQTAGRPQLRLVGSTVVRSHCFGHRRYAG